MSPLRYLLISAFANLTWRPARGKAPAADRRDRLAPATILRPVGTTWDVLVPGSPLHPRSRSSRATYEVVGHAENADGTPCEVVRRVKLEKV